MKAWLALAGLAFVVGSACPPTPPPATCDEPPPSWPEPVNPAVPMTLGPCWEDMDAQRVCCHYGSGRCELDVCCTLDDPEWVEDPDSVVCGLAEVAP